MQVFYRWIPSMLVLALAVGPFAFAKDEAKVELPPDVKTCENQLQFTAFQPQWRAAIPEIANPAAIFARGSSLYDFQPMTKEMIADAADQGLSIDFDSSNGSVTLSHIDPKNSRVAPQIKARIPLPEPISKIEFFATGNTSGFVVLLGWTRVHYYELKNNKIHECTAEDLRDFNPMWEAGLYPLPLKIEKESHDETAVTDSRGQTVYLSSKQIKNFADAVHESIENLATHPPLLSMRDPHFPGEHAIHFFWEWRKFHERPIGKLNDIFTKAAFDVAQLKNPDLSEFFSPMVDLAFSFAFRDVGSGARFVKEFIQIVVQASKGTVVPVPGFKAYPGDRDVAELQAPDGTKYLLHYQPFSKTPLTLLPVSR